MFEPSKEKNPQICSGVVMIGTPIEGRGGISSVIAAYRGGGIFERCGIIYLSPVTDGSVLKKILVAGRTLFHFLYLLLFGQVRIVHIHVASGFSFWRKSAFSLLANAFSKPVILHVHGGNFADFFSGTSRFGQWLITLVFRRARRVVVLSDVWIKRLERFVVANQCVVIVNPVIPPLEVIKPRVEKLPIRFVFLGRLEKDKGAYDLLEAFAELVEVFPEVFLVMGGDGELKECEQLADLLGVRDKVDFPGWVAGVMKSKLLSEADVFVLPSHVEGLPVSMLEAMSFALPVVTCPVGSIPEVIDDGVEAIFVPPANVKLLATAMFKLVLDPNLRGVMGNLGLKKFDERYSIQSVAPSIEALYLDVLNENL